MAEGKREFVREEPVHRYRQADVAELGGVALRLGAAQRGWAASARGTSQSVLIVSGILTMKDRLVGSGKRAEISDTMWSK